MADVAPCRRARAGRRPGRSPSAARATRLRADDAPAQFVRFVTVGVLTTAVYFGVFLSLRPPGSSRRTSSGAVLSSMLANELHRRLTFHAGGGSAGSPPSSRAAGWPRPACSRPARRSPPSTGASGRLVGDLLLIAGVTGAVGLARFVALRLWVFPGHRTRRRPSRPA